MIEMHPPKLIVYGGMINGGTFEFDEPDTVEAVNSEDGTSDDPNLRLSGGFAGIERSFIASRRKGKKNNALEETDDAVYFLTLLSHDWIWRLGWIHLLIFLVCMNK